MKKTLPTCCLPCSWILKWIDVPTLPCSSLPPPLPWLLSLHRIKGPVHFISNLSVFVPKKIQRCRTPFNGPPQQAMGLDPLEQPVLKHSTAYLQVFILWDGNGNWCTVAVLYIWSDFITQSRKTLSSDGVWSQGLLGTQTLLECDAEALQQQTRQPSPSDPLSVKGFLPEEFRVSVGELLSSCMQQVASLVFSEHPKKC